MSIADDEPLRDVTDRAIRQSLQQTDNLRDFLHQAVPELADGFDCFHAKAPEAPVSARIRDLTNEMGLPHEKRKAKDGNLYQYRLTGPRQLARITI